MSETDEEGEPGMHLEDERKLMRSVLSQFDDGPAKTELQDAKQPAEVPLPHHDTAMLYVSAVLHVQYCSFLALSCQNSEV